MGWLIKREIRVSVGKKDLKSLEETAEDLLFDSPDHTNYFYAGLTILRVRNSIQKRGMTLSQYHDLFEGKRPFFVRRGYEFYFNRKCGYRLKLPVLRKARQSIVFPVRSSDKISA